MPFKVMITNLVGPKEYSRETEYIFNQAVVTLGRNEANIIPLPDSKRVISSKHAEIRHEGAHYVLEDVGSKNGTMLNDQRLVIGVDYPIADEDVIEIGSYRLVFHVITEPSTAVIRELDPDATVCFSSEPSPLEATVQQLKRVSRQLNGRDPKERSDMLLEALRESVMGLPPEETLRVVDYVEAAFPDPDYQHELLLSRPERRSFSPQGSGEADKVSAAHQLSINQEEKDVRGTPLTREEVATGLTRQKEAALTLFLEYLADVVRSRKEFEQELEVEVTKIFSRERNAIKCADSPQEIADHLFPVDRTVSAQAEALKDLKETLSDVSRHPFGMMAGFRECIRGLLRQLHPGVISSEAKSRKFFPLFSAWPSFSKNAAWDRYVHVHHTLTEEETKTIQNLLRKEFGKGYLRAYHEVSKP